VEGFNGDELFLSLFQDDVEGKKINLIPDADELLAEFHEKFVAICVEMYRFGIKQKDMRQKELDEFWRCLIDAKTVNTDEATAAIDSFMEIKRAVSMKHMFNYFLLLCYYSYVLIVVASCLSLLV
jgi:hypothetical protein